MTLDTAAKQAGAFVTILTLFGILATGFNAYHANLAKAEDVQALSQVVSRGEIRRIDEKLEEIESEIAILTAKTNKDQADEIKLTQLKQRRERYLADRADLKGAE